MRNKLFIVLLLSIMMCTSCEQVKYISKNEIQETSVEDITTTEESTQLIEETSIVTEQSVSKPKLYPEQMFNQMSQNLDGLNITLYIKEDRYSSNEITSSNIDLISSYFKDCTYQPYTFDDNSYNGNSMNIVFYPKDNDGNIYDSYSINFYDISNLNLEDGNCKIEIQSVNYQDVESYIINVSDIQSVFEDLKSIF